VELTNIGALQYSLAAVVICICHRSTRIGAINDHSFTPPYLLFCDPMAATASGMITSVASMVNARNTAGVPLK
jgi:hypothetical protein